MRETIGRRYLLVVRLVLGLASFFVLGNLVILSAHLYLQRSSAPVTTASGADYSAAIPIKNFTVVDDHVWRGAAPTPAGYRALAEAGVTTVVDLRAEDDIRVDEAALADLGVSRIHLPMRDGQAPSAELVHRFLDVVAKSDGVVYVHCGAGVGRTGTMAAAYLVGEGVPASQAVRRNLAVGPPSLEQLAFAAGLRNGSSADRPPSAVVAVSRALDAPRRLWVNLRNSYE